MDILSTYAEDHGLCPWGSIMRTYLDCFPCFLQQALRIGRISTEDEYQIKQLIDEVGMMLKDIPLESTPPETAMLIYEKVRETIGNTDP